MRRSFVGLTLTQSGFLLGLSPAIVGFALGRQLGLATAVSSIVVGCWLTVALGLVAARMGWSFGMPTAELAVRLLGRRGGRLLGLALACAFVGWLRIHALAIAAAGAGGGVSSDDDGSGSGAALLVCCAVLSAAMVQRHNGWLARLSAVQAPSLVLLFAYALYAHPLPTADAWQAVAPHWPSALLILAAGLSDVLDLPTRLRDATSLRAALGAVICTYGGVLPAMLLFGAVLAGAPGATDVVTVLAAGGPAFAVAVKVLVVTSATVANAGLLWSGSQSLGTAFATRRVRRLRWWMAAGGLLLSFGPMGASIEAVLAILGCALAGVGLVMQTAFLAQRGQKEVEATLQHAHATAAALAIGCGLAVLAASHLRGWPEAWAIWAAATAGVGFTLLCRAGACLRA